MKILKLHRVIPVIALALSATFCTNPGGDSSVQSLDNFARSADSKLVMNKCGWGLEDSETADDAFINQLLEDDGYIKWGADVNKEELMPELRQSLKAIPGVVHLAFFGLHGSFEITNETSTLCAGKVKGLTDKSTFFTEGSNKIKSCWDEVYREVETEDKQSAYEEGFVVYIDPSKESIQHSVLRSFGQLMSEHLHKFDLDEEQNGIVMAGPDAEFEDFKMTLAERLLQDVVESRSGQSVYDLAYYKNMLGAEITAAQSTEAVRAAWDNLRAKAPATAQEFASYVFAESFDSFYCSPDTREKMAKEFDDTFAFFLEAAKKVEEAKSLLPSYDSRDKMAQGEESSGENLIPADDSDEHIATVPGTHTYPMGDVYMPLTGDSYGLLFFGFFRGVGRAIGGIARGIGRIGVGIVRGVGHVVGGIARGVARVGGAIIRGAGAVVRGVGRVVGGIIRGTGRVILGIARGVGRIAVGALRVGANVIGGAVRGAAILGAWALRGTGRVIRGLFGPFAYLNGCYGYSCGGQYSAQDADMDNDGIKDQWDLCSNTAKGVRVYSYRHAYAGCASGQWRDRDLANRLVNSGYTGTDDADADGIINDEDKCSNTPKGIEIIKSSDRNGCAEGQLIDAEVIETLANKLGQTGEEQEQSTGDEAQSDSTDGPETTQLDCNKLNDVRAAGSGICKNHSSGFCYRVGNGQVLYNLGQVSCQ